MRKLLWRTLAAAAVCGAPAFAQEDDLFSKLDTNKDGFVAGDEVEGERKSLFERMLRNADKDGDKKLSKAEFQAGLSNREEPGQPLGDGPGGRPGAGPNAQELFNRADGNGDGKLSKEEAPQQLKPNFERVDGDSDGFITREEFGRALAALGGRPGAGGPQQAEAMFDRLDANKDGKVTKDELPEDRREQFTRMLERVGGESLTKEQFVRAMGIMQGGGRPGGPEGAPPPGRMPLFASLDTDGDSELSSDEIAAASKSLLALDKDGNGKLSREELFPGGPFGRPGDRPGEGRPGEGRPNAGLPARNAAEFLARLKAADANKDGKLSRDEVASGFPVVKENFDRIDTNSDGFVDEAELGKLGERREGGDRPEGGRPEGRRGDRRPEGDRPGGDRRPEGDRPGGDRRPE